ncbi:hypothetical protein BG015_007494 [Linnemannia schmuckeri]|uniref:F-box domain-containing protein n=1 Tax=Linnemannia schmuckeri TaxID=64567 RepID=A0A9P5S136_9FUNG|nr:hypothetical protein BG015_007494 [Linnemannia schmuckeri]
MWANPQHLKTYIRQSRRRNIITGFGKWVPQPPRRPDQHHQQQQQLTTPTAVDTMTTLTNPPSQQQLPPELWTQVFSFLYPSQLSPIAAVNKTWRDLVHRLPIWRLISSEAGLLVRSKFFPEDYEWVPNHFVLVQEKSQEICEECYKRFPQHEVERVLPVRIVFDKFHNRNSNNDGDGNNDNNRAVLAPGPTPDIMIQMCRPCRIDYYSKHPEPIPKRLNHFYWEGTSYKVTPRIDGNTASLIYGLSTAYIRSLPFENAPPSRSSIHEDDDDYQHRRGRHQQQRRMHIFQEPAVLQLARKVHGGDVGIAYYCVTNPSYSPGSWNRSNPQDDTTKKRQVYLRSLMYDRGITPPSRSIACDAFVESGQGDPTDIVEDLDMENWFMRRTNYYHPNQIGTRQVKLRLRPGRRQTRLRGLFEDQKGGGGEEKEEDKEWYKLSVLNNWLENRLENGLYKSYKLDPEGPENPPESLWPLIDRIDMGHIALVHAAECIVEVLEEEKKGRVFGVEELEEFGLTIEQICEMIDRRANRDSGSGTIFTLSMLLEDELGEGWDALVVQRVKNLLQSQPF